MSQKKAATKIVMLGTGTPNPDPNRQGPSTAVVVNEQPYVFDCGPGIVRQVTAAHKMGMEAFTMPNLNRLFITHLHSDHTIGLPDFVLTPAVTGRLGPLEIWGPIGTADMVAHIKEAYRVDIEQRLHGGEPSVETAYKTIVHEISEGEVFKDKNVRITAFKVQHGSWAEAYGYRIDTLDKSIVLSGDTTFCPNLIKNAKACDILVHEACSAKGMEQREPEWKAYHSKHHTTGIDAGRTAAEISPNLLILNHVLLMGQSEDQLLDEVRVHYSGKVVIARDLDVY